MQQGSITFFFPFFFPFLFLTLSLFALSRKGDTSFLCIFAPSKEREVTSCVSMLATLCTHTSNERALNTGANIRPRRDRISEQRRVTEQKMAENQAGKERTKQYVPIGYHVLDEAKCWMICFEGIGTSYVVINSTGQGNWNWPPKDGRMAMTAVLRLQLRDDNFRACEDNFVRDLEFPLK